jgi:gas vesicle protein
MEMPKDMTITIDTAGDVTMDAVKGARGGLLDNVKSVVEVVSFLRSLGADNVLRKVGLLRPKTSLASLGVFATGLALGAGLGMLFAPMSGRQTRGYVRGQMRKVGGEVKERAAAAASLTEGKLEEALVRAEEAVEKRSEGAQPGGKKAGRNAVNGHKAAV